MKGFTWKISSCGIYIGNKFELVLLSRNVFNKKSALVLQLNATSWREFITKVNRASPFAKYRTLFGRQIKTHISIDSSLLNKNSFLAEKQLSEKECLSVLDHRINIKSQQDPQSVFCASIEENEHDKTLNIYSFSAIAVKRLVNITRRMGSRCQCIEPSDVSTKRNLEPLGHLIDSIDTKEKATLCAISAALLGVTYGF